MTDHFATAATLAERVHADTKALAAEYAKPIAPVSVRANGFVERPALAVPEGGYRNPERINQLQGRAGRLMKRAEVHALLAVCQRLDDLAVKL